MNIENYIPKEYTISDKEINAAWANANFGVNADKRMIIVGALAQISAGYRTGHTAQCICQELGLLGKMCRDRSINLTKKGKRWLYHAQEYLTRQPTQPVINDAKASQAYQVIGELAGEAGLFDNDEVTKALDYFASDKYDENFLPWNVNVANPIDTNNISKREHRLQMSAQDNKAVVALKIIASGGEGQYQWSLTKAETLAKQALTNKNIESPANAGCESCEDTGRIYCSPDNIGNTHPCDNCQPEALEEFNRGVEFERSQALTNIPNGYVLVPVEPTDRMYQAGYNVQQKSCITKSVVGCYKAMIAAAKEGE